MGLFDFLKKKEFEEIAKLRIELNRYKPIKDIEAEISKKTNEINALIASKEKELIDLKNDFSQLKSNYTNALDTYTKIRKEISLYENKIDLIEFGVYEPIYQFDKSDDYRQEQNKIIELQKEMISSEKAAICRTNWTIEGSEAKGKASTKKYIKLTLRAFNGECESLIAKVKWNNVNQMKERITKSYETINKIGESKTVSIQPEYLELKIKELLLEYEYQLKKQNEREELRAAQEALREEEKARREYELAQKEAEKEEANYQKALEKARKEIESTTGEKYDKLQAQIAKLELELQEAHDKKNARCLWHSRQRGVMYI